MSEMDGFTPDWASPPGDTISDLLREKSIPLLDFSRRLGRSEADVEKIIDGRLRLTSELAHQLEKELGATAKFWESRESQYRRDLTRLRAANLTSADKEWVRDLPLSDMVRFNWISPVRTVSEKFAESLEFFGVDDIPQWREKYEKVLSSASFKSSSAFDSHVGATVAWLRQGELIAEGMDCKAWSAEHLSDSLKELRSLTREDEPEKFIPAIQELCAASGVAVVIARAPTGCRASGATRFISPDRALVLLSFRYLSDDHFWFSFFHELGHILLHKSSEVFLEVKDMTISQEEAQANAFSEQILIPSEYHEEMMGLAAEYRPIMKFAKKIGVSPGIVVGQLQHYGRLKRAHMNKLKTRYVWPE